MRVLFLTNIPSPYRVDFFNELGKFCDLTVLYERNSADDRNKDWYEKSSINFKSIVLKGKNIRADSALCFGVLKYLSKRKFDIIVVGGYATATGMLAINYMKIMRIPFILSADGALIKENENILKRLIKKYYISGASYWLSTGKGTSDYLLNYGAKKSNIFIYPFTSLHKNHILISPLTDTEKVQLKKDLDIKSDLVVICVGQFIRRKGIDILLKAWNEIKNNENNELIIIGGGELENDYYNYIKEKNLTNVSIIGFQKKEMILKYYKAADFMVLLTREDIWGLVINEALACGLPIITTDKCLAGLELIKNGENGFIVPVDEVSASADKISLFLNEENLIKSCSQKAIESIKDYTIENMALTHYNIFKIIAGEN